MDVSVVLATYRRPDLLARTLASFAAARAAGFSAEILLVDNDPQRSAEGVGARFEGPMPLRVLVEPERGKNRALNRAVAVASGELVVFTDDDVVVEPDWLEQMRAASRRWPEHLLFGGRVLPLWPAGLRAPTLPRRFVEMAYGIADWSFPEGPYPASKVFGTNMAIRREVFERGWRFNPDVGPSEGNYVMGGETELTLRLEAAGVEPIYVPRSVVQHAIRPEQLERDWMRARAFRSGRALAFRQRGWPKAPKVFGVPRFLLRRAIELGARRAVLGLAANGSRRLELDLQYARTRGMIHQCRAGGSDS